VTANEGDGIFLLKPCGVTDKYQRFNVIWDFDAKKFLLYSVGLRAYIDFTSPVRGGMYETNKPENSLVNLVPSSKVAKSCKGDTYTKHDDHSDRGHPDEGDGSVNGQSETWFIVNRFGEYLLGGIEYTSFDAVLNPECSDFQDFYKFVLTKWGDPYFTVDDATKQELEQHYFSKDRANNSFKLNPETNKYEKMSEEQYKATLHPK
jgi:hypothetical protein